MSPTGRAFVAGDWGAALGRTFELIVANPPYIATGAIAALAPEVRDHDPTGALDGGPDGLDAYRSIFADARRLLAPGGRLVVEIGFDQEAAVRAIAAAAGLPIDRVAKDLGGHARAVVLRPPDALQEAACRARRQPGVDQRRERRREPVDESLIERQVERRARQVLGIADEGGRLVDQPKGRDGQLFRAHVLGQVAPHDPARGREDRQLLGGDEVAEHVAGADVLPGEQAQRSG